MSLPPISQVQIDELIELARRAGEAIMAIYRQRDHQGIDAFNVEQKTDLSPLTAADLAAHTLIVNCLPHILPVPIISEEGALPDYQERSGWSTYWLVDPLDGTKEFIAGNGEFTVNIALIYQGHPYVGVVHVPVTEVTYIGVLGAEDPQCIGAWKYVSGVNPQLLHVRSLTASLAQEEPFVALLSHRHATQATLDVMAAIAQYWPGDIATKSAGSSLKFCLIAEGAADFYPRLAPTSEWDTAAAQAVLEAAGGRVVQVPERHEHHLMPLVYNARDDIINPHFFALGDGGYDWSYLLGLSAMSNSKSDFK